MSDAHEWLQWNYLNKYFAAAGAICRVQLNHSCHKVLHATRKHNTAPCPDKSLQFSANNFNRLIKHILQLSAHIIPMTRFRKKT